MRLKDQRSKNSKSGTGNTHLAGKSEPCIVHEARKRRKTQLEDELSNPTLAGKNRKLLKII